MKIEACLTYPVNQYGFIDRYDAQNALLLLFSIIAFSKGVLPTYSPSLSVNFETTSHL